MVDACEVAHKYEAYEWSGRRCEQRLYIFGFNLEPLVNCRDR